MRDQGRKGFIKRKVLHHLLKTIRLVCGGFFLFVLVFFRKSSSSYILWRKNPFPQFLAILDLPYHRISITVKHNYKYFSDESRFDL